MSDEERVVRRQRKAAITRHLGTLERLVAEEDVDDVKERLDIVKRSFRDFEIAHDLYHDGLVEDDDVEESDSWFQQVQTSYVAGVRSAKAWLKTQEDDGAIEREVAVDRSDIMSAITQSDLINSLNVPKVEIDKFEGNPLDYLTFMAIFDEVVHTKVMDGQVKLTRLLQYTSGPAKMAIKNCALIGGDAGYAQARAILKNRYGNSHLVSHMIISDLTNGKRITKANELQQLADELSTALIALGQLGNCAELNTQQSIIDILQRCQPYVRNNWRKKALDCKRRNDVYPAFDEFVAFVQNVASEACDPVYGAVSTKSHDGVRGENYATVANNVSAAPNSASGPRQNSARMPEHSRGSSDRPCVVCAQPHRLYKCDTFKRMRPDERFNVARQCKLCFNCLLPNHCSNACRKQSVCSVPGCGRKHSKFLHVYRDNVDQVTNAEYHSNDNDSNQLGVASNMSVNRTCSSVYLPIVPVIINDQCKVYALLDTGSTNTFVTQRLATQLKLKGKEVSYSMSTLGHSSEVSSKTVSINVMSVDANQKLKADNVLVVGSIPVRYPTNSVDINVYPHLADLPMPRAGNDVQVDVLIGMDNAYALMPLEVRCSSSDRRQPYATRTLFGWSLNGPVDNNSCLQVSSHCVDLGSEIDKLWEVETLDEDARSLSYADRRVLDLWDREIVHEDGHYVIPVPWKDESATMPNNKYAATSRLNNLISRLRKTEMLEQYSGQLKKMEMDGYAEKVPVEETHIQGDKVWYLPHHAVVSTAKPGKVRVVFDCAAKHGEVCLNNQCFQGPDLNNKLIHVLLRFRQYRYAVTADIEAMCHQVKIPTKDRNALRFLWQEEDGSQVEYRMTSHLFGGVWCASSSTYALRKIVQDTSTDELVTDTICRSFYVDDMLRSVRTREEAADVIRGTKEALKYGGFNLTKYVVNDTQLLESIDVTDRAKEVKEITPEMYSKALGIRWDVNGD